MTGIDDVRGDFSLPFTEYKPQIDSVEVLAGDKPTPGQVTRLIG